MFYNRVCAVVKTFCRDEALYKCVETILDKCQGIKLIIVDDGSVSTAKDDYYKILRSQGHVVIQLPFDGGYGLKFNVGLAYCDREFVLNVDDDFIFGPGHGIDKMAEILDENPEVGVVGGRANNTPYEGFLEYGDGFIKEILLKQEPVQKFYLVDITCMYWLARRETLRWVKIDQEYKIGGEHLDFFQDVAKTGAKIAFCPDANVGNGFKPPFGSDYKLFRARRAWRPRFYKKHNITRFFGFHGEDLDDDINHST